MGVLDSAELLLQAKNYSGSGGWLDEANSHNAQLGSTSGADTNDPLFLEHTGIQYLYLPGISGNYVSAPDSAAYDITGDIEAIVCVLDDDWDDGNRTFVAKWPAGNLQRQYLFRLIGGSMRMDWFEADATAQVETSSVGVPFTDNTIGWMRWTLDVDNGASDAEVKFYTSTDPASTDPSSVSWTQLGTTQLVGATTDVRGGGNDVLEWGASSVGTAQLFNGNYYKAVLNNGIGGTSVATLDFTDTVAVTEPFATFTEASAQADTVTISRTATGRKAIIVDRNLFLLGTDDFFEVPDDAALDFATGDDFTGMVVGRSYDVSPSADSILLAKKDNLTTSAGYAIYLEAGDDTVKFLIGDATADDEDASPDLTAGQLFTVAGVRDAAGDNDIQAFFDGTGSGSAVTDSTADTLANAFPLRIGATSNTAASFFDGEIVAVALWSSALSDADVATARLEITAANDGSFAMTNAVGPGRLLRTGT